MSPLLSRSLLLTLEPLTDDDVGRSGQLVDRDRPVDGRGLAGLLDAEADDAREHLVRLAQGDARRALTALEAAAGSVPPPRALGVIDLARRSRQAVQTTAALRYDRDGDQHYDVISAFIKSIRGSDPDAALHYLARMIDRRVRTPRFIARRLVVHASEDVGLADPTALLAATAAARGRSARWACPRPGSTWPRPRIHLALAPKSNAVVVGHRRRPGRRPKAGLAGSGAAAPLRDGHYRRLGQARPRPGLPLPARRPGRRRHVSSIAPGRARRRGRRTTAPRVGGRNGRWSSGLADAARHRPWRPWGGRRRWPHGLGRRTGLAVAGNVHRS